MELKKPKDAFRIAHISDLHFNKASYGLNQFFSKRWIGNLNLLLFRKQEFHTEKLLILPELFKDLEVDCVLITGDLTTTSLKEEFQLALNFVRTIQDKKISVELLPGNHDHYTKKAYRNQLFYRFFPSIATSKVSAKLLSKDLWLITLDCALATSLFSSQGHFSPSVEKELLEALATIPSNQQILIANHFPLFQQEGIRKALLRSEALRAHLHSKPHIRLYLHGHTHRHCIADLRPSGLPIILDSGSTSQRTGGSWNLIDLNKTGCDIHSFKWKEELLQSLWKPTKKSSFTW